MRVLITGATSMIGAALANRLAGAGYEVCAVVRKNSARIGRLSPRKNLEIVECDMEGYSRLPVPVGKRIDVVFSAAWNGTRGGNRNDPVIQKSNYHSSLELLHFAIGAGCRKFITAGSQAEYGPLFQTEKITEDTVPHPNTEYGKYKLLFYDKAAEICAAARCTLLEPRFFSLYGPDDYEGSLIISILKKMIAGEPCDLTECVQLWDFLYIDDAAEGLLALIQGNTEGIYNFGCGVSRPLRSYVERMLELAGSSSRLNFGAVPYPASGIVNLNPDVEKLKKTGWTPAVGFDEGIRRILNVMKIGS